MCHSDRSESDRFGKVHDIFGIPKIVSPLSTLSFPFPVSVVSLAHVHVFSLLTCPRLFSLRLASSGFGSQHFASSHVTLPLQAHLTAPQLASPCHTHHTHALPLSLSRSLWSSPLGVRLFLRQLSSTETCRSLTRGRSSDTRHHCVEGGGSTHLHGELISSACHFSSRAARRGARGTPDTSLPLHAWHSHAGPHAEALRKPASKEASELPYKPC